MDQSEILIAICGMAVVTCLPRILPALFLSGRRLHPAIARWLGFVPATVLAALLAPGLLCPEQKLMISFDNIFLVAAVPAFAAALFLKNFFATVAVGMGVVALARYFF
ncbi:MAG: AzlD domain-containing protein [Desulfobulbaceae bacterium]|jgi:branched-subunit amino acid transport protein|nr:AzlD domain-containing protein [Desulfobulbaceae bacterium]